MTGRECALAAEAGQMTRIEELRNRATVLLAGIADLQKSLDDVMPELHRLEDLEILRERMARRELFQDEKDHLTMLEAQCAP